MRTLVSLNSTKSSTKRPSAYSSEGGTAQNRFTYAFNFSISSAFVGLHLFDVLNSIYRVRKYDGVQ